MTTIAPSPLDYGELDRLLDRVKSKTFIGKNAAFLAPLMCQMAFHWSEDVPTAATDGTAVWWNPRFFLDIRPTTREFVLVHELWHPGFLHPIRCGGRDPEIWNYAADIIINNQLDSEGYDWQGLPFKIWLDHRYDGWTTEQVYDDLVKNAVQVPVGTWGDDLKMPANPDEAKRLEHAVVANVVMAANAAKQAGKPGDVPGEASETLQKFLDPKLPWQQILWNFFNQLGGVKERTWRRPSRRYPEIYMPSRLPAADALDHLAFFIDVSGSISKEQAHRFLSEFKHVKEAFTPQQITMVQFDTVIQKVIVYTPDDEFEEVDIKGRGGTSLVEVRDWIVKHRPTAAIVFSDMDCAPMQALPGNAMIPMIWVALDPRQAFTVPHGQVIHLED